MEYSYESINIPSIMLSIYQRFYQQNKISGSRVLYDDRAEEEILNLLLKAKRNTETEIESDLALCEVINSMEELDIISLAESMHDFIYYAVFNITDEKKACKSFSLKNYLSKVVEFSSDSNGFKIHNGELAKTVLSHLQENRYYKEVIDEIEGKNPGEDKRKSHVNRQIAINS